MSIVISTDPKYSEKVYLKLSEAYVKVFKYKRAVTTVCFGLNVVGEWIKSVS